MSKFSPRQMFLLDEACKPIKAAFDEYPYLVGSSTSDEGVSHDVDVRLILPDEKYDALASAIDQNVIRFMGFAIGEYLAARTGLPIDFQLQRRTEANEKHKGRRNPLGIRDLSDYVGDASPKQEKVS